MTEETKEIQETEETKEIQETEETEETEEKQETEETKEILETEKKFGEGGAEKESLESKGKDNIIFVGVKPFMNYVTGVVMQFQNKGQDEVIVSARGKFISKAVDVVEVARRTFLREENIKVEDIKISSEQFENKEGKRIYVSAIALRLSKNK